MVADVIFQNNFSFPASFKVGFFPNRHSSVIFSRKAGRTGAPPSSHPFSFKVKLITSVQTQQILHLSSPHTHHSHQVFFLHTCQAHKYLLMEEMQDFINLKLDSKKY